MKSLCKLLRPLRASFAKLISLKKVLEHEREIARARAREGQA